MEIFKFTVLHWRSQFYFGRSIREISLDQIALLVGMVKGPSLYNPWRNPQYALDRRNVVLKLMLDHQMIGDELYEMLSKRPLGVQAKGQISRKYLLSSKPYKRIFAVNWGK